MAQTRLALLAQSMMDPRVEHPSPECHLGENISYSTPYLDKVAQLEFLKGVAFFFDKEAGNRKGYGRNKRDARDRKAEAKAKAKAKAGAPPVPDQATKPKAGPSLRVSGNSNAKSNTRTSTSGSNGANPAGTSAQRDAAPENTGETAAPPLPPQGGQPAQWAQNLTATVKALKPDWLNAGSLAGGSLAALGMGYGLAGSPLVLPGVVAGGALGSLLGGAAQKAVGQTANIGNAYLRRALGLGAETPQTVTPADPGTGNTIHQAVDPWKTEVAKNLTNPATLKGLLDSAKTGIGTGIGGTLGAAAGFPLLGAPGMLAGAYLGGRRVYEKLRPRTFGEQAADAVNKLTPELSNLGDRFLDFKERYDQLDAGGAKRTKAPTFSLARFAS